MAKYRDFSRLCLAGRAARRCGGCRRARRAHPPGPGHDGAGPTWEVPLHHARPWFVGAVVTTTTALLVVAAGGTDVAGADGGAARQAAVATLAAPGSHDTGTVPHAASRDAERKVAVKADDNGLTRADVAWQRALTAAAEAWLRAHPPAIVTPAPPVTHAPTPTPDAVPVAPPAPAVETPSSPPPAADPPRAAPSARATADPGPPTDFRAEAEAFLDTLPGGASASIEWGDPDGHLGGVWIPGSETIILNAARLDGRLEQTKDVLRHEIGHVHQNRAMAAAGWSLPDFEAHLDDIFGGQGIERSADAVAVLLGAGSLRYASSFTDAQLEAARALLEDRVP